MKFTLNWLKEHLETSASLDQICETLTMIGIEVEGIDDLEAKLAPFKIVEIQSLAKHPKSTKLNLCQVDCLDGNPPVQIVCGAPNVYEKMKTVLAPIGSFIEAKNLEIKSAEIAGEASSGMLCSAAELGTGLDHDGIIDLPANAPLGARYCDYIGLNDQVIEIKVTPNRGDALGVRGIARDLAAAGLGTLKPLRFKQHQGDFESPITWQIEDANNSDQACYQVAGRYFKNVKNINAPQWLQQRLIVTGHRPISSLVDITNYVTFDLGRPLHVYDADKLSGNNLSMRLAKAGESLKALDDNLYPLDQSMTVIADDDAPQAIAGIMGGAESGCSEATTAVFLEVGMFHPVQVTKTGRRLNLQSDARFRFERGIDQESIEWGVDVATQMILDLCGGEASTITAAGSPLPAPAAIPLNLAKLETYGGIALAADQAIAILKAIGCKVTGNSPALQVIPPSWRPDIGYEACLIEEITRIHGYDHIPACSLPDDPAVPTATLNLNLYRKMASVRLLCALGLDEIVSWSFISAKEAQLFGKLPPELTIANPISSELTQMRGSLWPNLLLALQKNTARGNPHCNFFEAGPVYHGLAADQQSLFCAGLRAGYRQKSKFWRDQGMAHYDVFDAKADLYALLELHGIDPETLRLTQDANPYYHPGQSARVWLDDVEIAQFGAFHPNIMDHFDLTLPIVGFECNLSKLPVKTNGGLSLNRAAYHPRNLQVLRRDFAFMMAQSIPASTLLNAIRAVDTALINHVQLFDLYQNEAMGDQKSLAVQVTIQPMDKTLKEADITALSNKIIDAAAAIGAALRQ